MITVFNRALLYQNTDAQAVAAVWSTLRSNGIRYEVSTKTYVSSFRRMLTQQRNINLNAGGIPATWTEKPRDYLYKVYVSKKDFAKAQELCNL